MIEAKPVPLFFAFPDGVFNYVCAECDALCCKGQGFGGSLKREMSFILKTYPALAAMTHSRQRDYVEVSTPTGRCYFLGSDNLCQIEVEHGSSKKPGVCIIFPFNRFQKVGETVFVLPHFMCPLRVEVPACPGEVTGTHAALEASLRASDMLESKYVDWYMKSPKMPPNEDPKSILTRETAFRDDCASGLGRARFLDVLAEHADDPRELARFTKRVAQLMAWGPPSKADQPDAYDDVLLAIASPIRASMLHVPADRLIRILALAERVVRRVFALSGVPPKPQAVHSVVQQSTALFSLLSRADDTVKLRNLRKDAGFGHPDLVFAEFLTKRDIGTVGVLQALENGFKRLPAPSDRTILANHVAVQVVGL